MSINRMGPSAEGAFGLLAWLESTRIILPLRAVSAEFSVQGELVNVELDQVFQQSQSVPLDVTYTFPLPAGATVYRCEMHVNGRVIRARAEEEATARRIVAEKKAEGRRTALVTSQRENVFTLELGNLAPGDLVVIRLAYFQTVSRLGDWVSFSIPFCPGVRYIPGKPLLRSNMGQGVEDDTDQVPDASRISPPRLDQLDPEAAQLSIRGRVEVGGEGVRDLSSPTHLVLVRDKSDVREVELAQHGALPDRDFVLRWSEVEAKELTATAWVDSRKGETHALVRIQAPIKPLREEDRGSDTYFLLDRSGSMEGIKWEKTARAFLEFLKLSGPKDRIWATLFSDDWQDVAEAPRCASDLLSDRGVLAIASCRVGGGTQILKGLRHVVEKMARFSADRIKRLIVITDGQVGNEEEIQHELKDFAEIEIHTVGIDQAVNDAFLKTLAADHHGSCTLLAPEDDIVGAVSRLAGSVRPAVFTKICFDKQWISPSEKHKPLFAGRSVCLPLRFNFEAELKSHLQEIVVSGVNDEGRPVQLVAKLMRQTNDAMGRLWAKEKIGHLLDHSKHGKAVELAKQYNLICKGVAFMAFDESECLKSREGAKAIYQPSLQRRGPTLGGTFQGAISFGGGRHRSGGLRAQMASSVDRLDEASAMFTRREAAIQPIRGMSPSGPSSIWEFSAPYANPFLPDIIALVKQLYGKTEGPTLEETREWLNRWREEVRALAEPVASAEPTLAWDSTVAKLCLRLHQAPLLNNAKGWQWIRMLCVWLFESPQLAHHRLRATMTLSDSLGTVLNANELATELLRKWVTTHVSPKDRAGKDMLNPANLPA